MEELRIAWVSYTDPRIGITLVPGHPTKEAMGAVVPRDFDADLERVTRDAKLAAGLHASTQLPASVLGRGTQFPGSRRASPINASGL